MAVSNFYPLINATLSVLPYAAQQATNYPVTSIATIFAASIAILYNWNRNAVTVTPKNKKITPIEENEPQDLPKKLKVMTRPENKLAEIDDKIAEIDKKLAKINDKSRKNDIEKATNDLNAKYETEIAKLDAIIVKIKNKAAKNENELARINDELLNINVRMEKNNFYEVARGLVNKILSSIDKTSFCLRRKLEEDGYIKLSRSTYRYFPSSMIIQNLGQKRDAQNNPLFDEEWNPVLNIDVFSLVHGEKGIIGKGAEKIQKYGQNENGEKLAIGRFFLMPKYLIEMKEISKEVKSISNAMFGDPVSMLTKRGIEEVFLFAPYAESDLEKAIMSGSLSEDEKALYAIQMLECLLELHKKGIYHRDVKPANILLCKGKAFLSDASYATKKITTRRSGTPTHQAIECLRYQWNSVYIKPNAYMKLDVYSMGITLHELFNESHPWFLPDYYSVSEENLEKLKKMNKIDFEKEFPKPNADATEIEHLIWKMKHIDPDVRPTTEEALAKVKEIFPNINMDSK